MNQNGQTATAMRLGSKKHSYSWYQAAPPQFPRRRPSGHVQPPPSSHLEYGGGARLVNIATGCFPVYMIVRMIAFCAQFDMAISYPLKVRAGPYPVGGYS